MMFGISPTLIFAALALLAAFLGGVKLEGWRRDAKELRIIEKAEADRRAHESYLEGVSVGYQQVAAELRRVSAVNRVETNRETVRVEYRCPVPDTGQRLLERAIDAANAAAGGGPAAAVPADRKAPAR
jgi:hypothetical protein